MEAEEAARDIVVEDEDDVAAKATFALGLLNKWQDYVLRGLQGARDILKKICKLTHVEQWQGYFISQWQVRKDLIKGISLYHRIAFRAHMLSELGAFDYIGGREIKRLLAECLAFLLELKLPLLVIDAEDLDGWADYDPPRASDPKVKGIVVWPPKRRGRRQDTE